jgi:hypothetical protein
MKKQQGTTERWKYIKENDLSIAQSNQVSLRQLHACMQRVFMFVLFN